MTIDIFNSCPDTLAQFSTSYLQLRLVIIMYNYIYRDYPLTICGFKKLH